MTKLLSARPDPISATRPARSARDRHDQARGYSAAIQATEAAIDAASIAKAKRPVRDWPGPEAA